MLKITITGWNGSIMSTRVEGKLSNGRAVNAVLSTDCDGRDAWWDEEELPCETGGVEIGDDEAGWGEIMDAIDNDPIILETVEEMMGS